MIEQRDELPEWTDEERKLLASARLDRPPVDSMPRTLHAATAAALSSMAAASTAAAVGAGGKSGAFLGLAKPLGLVKWLAVLGVAGGAAVGVEAWRTGRTGAYDGTALVTAAAPARGESRPAATTPSAARPAAEEAAPAATSTTPEANAAPATRSASGRAVRAEPSAATQPDLTRDIATLDEARRALRAGRASEALAALDRYQAEAGRAGALRTEAEVLRIEATAQSGDRGRAETLARAFLKRNPKSPYAARVRALLPP